MNEDMLYIRFEDNGQDFLFFDIEKIPGTDMGVVKKVSPFQQHIWGNMAVMNTDLKVGDHIEVSVSPADEIITIKHAIAEVSTQPIRKEVDHA